MKNKNNFAFLSFNRTFDFVVIAKRLQSEAAQVIDEVASLVEELSIVNCQLSIIYCTFVPHEDRNDRFW